MSRGERMLLFFGHAWELNKEDEKREHVPNGTSSTEHLFQKVSQLELIRQGDTYRKRKVPTTTTYVTLTGPLIRALPPLALDKDPLLSPPPEIFAIDAADIWQLHPSL